MRGNTKIIMAVALLAVTALACQALNNVPGGGESTVPTSRPVNTSAPVPVNTEVPAPITASGGGGDILLQDDFSSEDWGTGTDTDSSVEYVNNALYVVVFTSNYYVWSTPNGEDYQNIHAEVTVNDNSTDSAATFGILCDQQVANSSFYYAAVTRSGKYAIVKSAADQDDVILTNGGEWTDSDLITPNSNSYRIGADCGNGEIVLYVNGERIDSVSDATYSSGGVGLFAWSGDTASGTIVSFDDFLLSKLK